MSKEISYGIGREYLSHWTIHEALREVYQNFIDFGEYTENIEICDTEISGEYVNVTLTNSFIPKDLSFLRIGNSDKGTNENAIGKYGEGIKMAFLVFARENFNIIIWTQNYCIQPYFSKDKNIGEVLSIHYTDNERFEEKFKVIFMIPSEMFWSFKDKVLKPSDYIFIDDYHGSIVSKEKGCIYVGGLFVCRLENLQYAYNFPPQRIPLDRDRNMPRTWDINYHASKIKEAYGHFTSKDTSYSDSEYVEKIPEKALPYFKPTIVGNAVVFTTQNENGNDVVITNTHVTETLKKHSFFKDIIWKLKMAIIKGIGLYDLLLKFQQKYVPKDSEMEQDFLIILNRVEK